MVESSSQLHQVLISNETYSLSPKHNNFYMNTTTDRIYPNLATMESTALHSNTNHHLLSFTPNQLFGMRSPK